MNKFFSFFLCLFILSCDDGDLQIETLDFNEASLQTCGAVAIAQNNVLFKLNTNEALIMNLGPNALKNEVGAFVIEITASTSTTVSYRIFSDTATKNYFCDAVPPVSPTVVEEIIASQATIAVTTTNTGTATEPIYSHQIEITKITLQTASGQRITDLTVSEFGTVTTTN
tara:strand:- start:9543 stop:10052 length:510 start_codon:yes stop_codon:yes gene_type:complete